MIVNFEHICYYKSMENASERFDRIFSEQEIEFDEISQIVSSVEIMSDFKLYNHYLKKMKSLEPTVKLFKQLKLIKNDIVALNELVKENCDSDASAELENLEKQKQDLENKLKRVYAEQKQKENEKIVIEINSKDEELSRMLCEVFVKFLEQNEFEYKKTEGQSGSIKLETCGENVYDKFNVFSGKVKKILKGKESEAVVVVLKKIDTSFVLKDEDLEIQTSKSSGAGGQHINKTESAIKIIHKPTGIFAECQDERSQTKNKEKARELLLKKITQNLQEKSEKNEKNQRNTLKDKIFGATPVIVFDFDLNKLMVAKNKTEYKLKEILEGNLDLVFNDSVE